MWNRAFSKEIKRGQLRKNSKNAVNVEIQQSKLRKKCGKRQLARRDMILG